MQTDTEAPLTSSEAARIGNVSVQTIREWADAGVLPSVRTASGWRLFRRGDVERVAAERKTRG